MSLLRTATGSALSRFRLVPHFVIALVLPIVLLGCGSDDGSSTDGTITVQPTDGTSATTPADTDVVTVAPTDPPSTAAPTSPPATSTTVAPTTTTTTPPTTTELPDSFSGLNPSRIFARDFDPWPLSVDTGLLGCEDGGAVVFAVDGGDIYAINGTAIQLMDKRGWKRIDEIWLDNPAIAGTKIDIGDLIDLGLSLC